MSNKIRCYQCTVPRTTINWANYCTQEVFCRGNYCMKGPDDKSNGIFYGCVDTPPLDRDGNRESLYQINIRVQSGAEYKETK
uniref:Uncharacterized protein n=1 Tax=Heterorhabditis bacteriophora TaxID=37862 RepID=A0A1I7X3L4_HETBA